MEGYIVHSYKLAIRVLELRPHALIAVVDSLQMSNSYKTRTDIKLLQSKCTKVRMLFPFSLVHEEIVNNLIKLFGLERIRVPNSLLRVLSDRYDYSSLTDYELETILNLT